MFEFRHFEVVHWDFWKRTSFPLDEKVITVVGPNGSGKTTLLDGLRTLLGIECSADRNYRRYVRRKKKPTSWLRAVVKNSRSSRGTTAFFPIISPEVTIACRIKRKAGDWERHYTILEGNVPVEQLEEKTGKDWIGLKEYCSLLKDAGVGPAIRKVLSLEQGATDELCSKTPRELLTLVFDAFDDQSTLEHYQKAKDDQVAIKKELDQHDVELSSIGLQVQENQNKIDNYNDWRRRQESVEKILNEDIPRLEIQELLDQRRGGIMYNRGQRRELEKIRQEKNKVSSALEEINEKIVKAQEKESQAKQKESQLREPLDEVNGELAALGKLQQEKERLESVAKIQDAGFDPAAVEAEKNEAIERGGQIKARLQEIEREKRELVGRKNRLEASDKKDLPPQTEQVLQSLAKEGVNAKVFAETVEILMPEWQTAIEGLIAGEAYTLLLDKPEDRPKAMIIGEQQRYRHMITPDRKTRPQPTPGSVLEAVDFSVAVQSWVVDQLNQTQRVQDAREGNRLPTSQNWISLSGYHCTMRGGRHVGVDRRRFVFGAAAILSELEGINERLAELVQEEGKLRKEVTTLNETVTDKQMLLEGWDADAELKSKLHLFVEAEKKVPGLLETKEDLDRQYKEAKSRLERVQKEINELNRSVGGYNERNTSLQADIDRHKGVISKEQLKLKEWDVLLRSKRQAIPRSGRTREIMSALREEYGSLDKCRAFLELQQTDLRERKWETDPNVIKIGERLKNEYASKKELISRRRGDNNRALMEMERAREAYIKVLYATLRAYVKNIKTLGDIAGVEIQATLPTLVNDDASLASAGLDVKIIFDKKDNDETSGGQKVIKSLILLVGLMMEQGETGGFVFIDEPFAHLDSLNISLVSNFLRSSGSQFVLTTPSTHNINVYDASGITLSTRSWRAPEEWAPNIAWIRRDNDAVGAA